MQNRIDSTFARLRETRQKAFVAYVAAGDPNFETSLEIIKSLADAGADIIELGLPFSDPLADGIVNQMAAERALKSGMSTARAIELIRRFRETHQTPIVLFTYLNPIFTYGFEAFHHDAATAGADGILLLDLPPDEAALNKDLAIGAGLKHIRLIAPTTPPERVKILAQSSEGFIYLLSRTGVTGSHGAPSANIGAQVAAIRGVQAVGLDHHGHRVPAHVGAQTLFHLEVAGAARFVLRLDGVDIAGGGRKRHVDALLTRFLEQLLKQKVAAFTAFFADDRRQRVDPFACFQGVRVMGGRAELGVGLS